MPSPFPQIDVLEPQNKVLKFGAVPPGQAVRKSATVVNNSVAPVNFHLSFLSCVPQLQETKVSPPTPQSLSPALPKGFLPEGLVWQLKLVSLGMPSGTTTNPRLAGTWLKGAAEAHRASRGLVLPAAWTMGRSQRAMFI